MSKNILDLTHEDATMQPLKIVPMAGYDFQVTFENAMQTFEDLKLVTEVEQAILSTENAELIAYHMGRLGYTEDDGELLTTESALKGKEGFLAKLKDIKNKISAQFNGTFGPLSAIYKGMTGRSVKTLEELKAKLTAGDLVSVDKISDNDQKVLNNKLGMFSALGMNGGSVSDFIKLIQLPTTMAKTIIPENDKFLAIAYKGFGVSIDRIDEVYKKGDLPVATESVKFVKSIKGIEFKDGIEILNAIPMKIFVKNITFATVFVQDNKIMIETDTAMSKPVDIKPLNTADAIKLIDVAIAEIKSNQSLVDTLVANSKGFVKNYLGMGDTIAGWAGKGIVKGMSHQGMYVNLSRIHRYFGYFMESTRNLSYDFYEVNNFTQKLVKSSFTKK